MADQEPSKSTMGIGAQLMKKLSAVSACAIALVCATACSASTSSSPKNPAPGVGATPWPAPSDPLARARAAGLVPEVAERLQYHVHAHLDVFIDGKPIVVPAGIGIDITNPAVHTFDSGGQKSYGGITVPCDQPCISPLHTHDTTGVLHTESSTHKDNTFGQFLTEWGVTLPRNAVVYVNGNRFGGDPKTIDLANFTEIAVVIGTPPPGIPDSFPQ
jgi:hypothetical protein